MKEEGGKGCDQGKGEAGDSFEEMIIWQNPEVTVTAAAQPRECALGGSCLPGIKQVWTSNEMLLVRSSRGRCVVKAT